MLQNFRGVASDPIAKVSVACVWDNPLKVVSFFYIVLYLQESKSAKVVRLPTSAQGSQSPPFTSDVSPLPTREEPLLTSPLMTGDEQQPSSPSAVEYRPLQISPICRRRTGINAQCSGINSKQTIVYCKEYFLHVVIVDLLVPHLQTSTQDLPNDVVVVRIDSHTGMSPDPTSTCTTADSEKALLV